MFHVKDGWFFERTEDDGVHIINRAERLIDELLGTRYAEVVSHIDRQKWIEIAERYTH